MQRVEHEAVAAQGDDDIGPLRGDVVVTVLRGSQARPGGLGSRGEKSDLVSRHAFFPFDDWTHAPSVRMV
jgi:hypothetical protein